MHEQRNILLSFRLLNYLRGQISDRIPASRCLSRVQILETFTPRCPRIIVRSERPLFFGYIFFTMYDFLLKQHLYRDKLKFKKSASLEVDPAFKEYLG